VLPTVAVVGGWLTVTVIALAGNAAVPQVGVTKTL